MSNNKIKLPKIKFLGLEEYINNFDINKEIESFNNLMKKNVKKKYRYNI